MRTALTLTLLLSAAALGGPAVQFCVGQACAARIEALPHDAVGPLIAVDAVGNTADWGLYCSWRGVRVVAAGELTPGACLEARRRLDEAAEALTRAGVVEASEWARVRSEALRLVAVYPVRVLEVPRGEELVAGVYVPTTRTIHLNATLEGAGHELFHAVLKVRGGSIDHDAFNSGVDAVSRAARSRYLGRPVL